MSATKHEDRTFVARRLQGSLLRLLLLLERNVFLVQILLVLLRSLEYCSDRLKEHLSGIARLEGLQLSALPASHDRSWDAKL